METHGIYVFFGWMGFLDEILAFFPWQTPRTNRAVRVSSPAFAGVAPGGVGITPGGVGVTPGVNGVTPGVNGVTPGVNGVTTKSR